MMIERVWFAVIASVWALAMWMTGGDLPADDVTVTGPVYVAPVEVVTTPPTSDTLLKALTAVVTTQAQRGAQQVVVTTAPATPPPTPGVCESFRPWFTAEAGDFFIDRGILNRESGCGRDLLNERTGDSGPCQINPIHNRPGWFGGVEFGTGGWLHTLHRLTARHQLDSLEWLAACQTLFDVCGTGPWEPPYTCANRPL